VQESATCDASNNKEARDGGKREKSLTSSKLVMSSLPLEEINLVRSSNGHSTKPIGGS